MRVLFFANRHEMFEVGQWDELAGPFSSLTAAEAWCDAPPQLVGDPPDPVTIDRDSEGWKVYSLRPVGAPA